MNYLISNKELWNKKVEHHIKSEFYDMDGFLAGKTSLKDIEINLLGDVAGKSILHLQCHFGQDTLSLAKLGAKATGLDFSEEAINKAREINNQMGLDAEFVCCDVYEATEKIDKKFDIIFTSYGVIGWLPDLQKWAGVISSLLKPGGRLVFIEFHPVIWMMDNDFQRIEYSYFNKEAIVEKTEGTYADREADINLESVSWNHSLGEVIQSLIKSGLEITHFEEFDYSPYNCFSHTVEINKDKFRIAHLEDKIPMVYSIEAVKK